LTNPEKPSARSVRQPKTWELLMINCCRRASRALSFYSDDPGVSLRSTPGFMLSPRFAGLRQSFHQLDQSFL